MSVLEHQLPGLPAASSITWTSAVPPVTSELTFDKQPDSRGTVPPLHRHARHQQRPITETTAEQIGQRPAQLQSILTTRCQTPSTIFRFRGNQQARRLTGPSRRRPPHSYKQVKYAVDRRTPVNTDYRATPSKTGGPSILRRSPRPGGQLTETGAPVELAIVTNRAPTRLTRSSRAGTPAHACSFHERRRTGRGSARGRARATWAKAVGLTGTGPGGATPSPCSPPP